MSGPRIRRDEVLGEIDIEAAIAAGMAEPDEARSALFSAAAVAAALRADELEVAPYPLEFLAGCVRAVGLQGALELPEPLIGEQPTELVRGWMSAARLPRNPDALRDQLFARWLDAVAVVLTARRHVRATTGAQKFSRGDHGAV
ncbi:hypothetical protein [Nocardia pseudovaccinii]|uniref:hypothetical protein n=1 Tax=Nocardia pseudovaccinii TaxID=189540 RepID=UPI0007A5589C|nr:hypothetical protein [Nocardia pseudovaccinii]